jgi:hypothetical protein
VSALTVADIKAAADKIRAMGANADVVYMRVSPKVLAMAGGVEALKAKAPWLEIVPVEAVPADAMWLGES